MTTPTQRTLAALRADGWICAVVERYCAFTRRRHDLYGGIDVLAIRGGETLGVQATTSANLAARRAKLASIPALREWVRGGRRLEVWGWAKRGKRKERKLWRVRTERIAEADFGAVNNTQGDATLRSDTRSVHAETQAKPSSRKTT